MYQFYTDIDENLSVAPNPKLGEQQLKRKFRYRNKGSITWTKEKGLWLFNQIVNIPYPRRRNLPSLGDELDFQVHKFLISLDAYDESAKKKQDSKDIIFGTCFHGYKYAKILKDYRDLQFKFTVGAGCLASTEFFKGDHRLQDIGEIFNYNYLIHWKTPIEEVTDFDDFSFIPVDIDEEVLEEFRNSLRALLETCTIEPIKKEEILFKISSSKAFDPRSEKSKHHWQLKEGNAKISNSIGLVKRSIIDVGPANVRDTIILQPESLARVNLIDYQVQDIVEQLPYNAQFRDEERKKSLINHLFQGCSIFYMRDIKKEGLTKPRRLLKVMLEELKSQFPEAEAFEYPDFFEDYHVQDNSCTRYPTRGHGLGMANSLTTLMQIAINHMCCSRLLHIEEPFDTLVLNDDHIARFDSQEFLEEYEYVDREILEGLSIIQNFEKSIFARGGFVFCENYFSHMSADLNFKESYNRRLCLLPLLCINIVEAKRLAASISKEDTLPYLERYKDEYVSKFGYEFYPEESSYPILCGGWFSRRLNGIRLDLKDLEDKPFKSVHLKAYEACKENRLNYGIKAKERFYRHPILKLYPGVQENTELVDILGGTDYKKLYNIMLKPHSYPEAEHQAWERLEKKRKAIFNKKVPLISLKDFCEKVYNESFLEIFYPPSVAIKKWVQLKETNADIRDYYVSKNAILSSVATCKIYRHLADIAETFSILFGSEDLPRKTAKDFIKCYKALQIHSPNMILVHSFQNSNFVYYSPEDENLAEEQWYNSHRMMKCAFHLEGIFQLPITFFEPNKEVIQRKKEIYSRFLTTSEKLFFAASNVTDRREIKKFVILKDYYSDFFENDIDILDYIINFKSLKEEYDRILPKSSVLDHLPLKIDLSEKCLLNDDFSAEEILEVTDVPEFSNAQKTLEYFNETLERLGTYPIELGLFKEDRLWTQFSEWFLHKVERVWNNPTGRPLIEELMEFFKKKIHSLVQIDNDWLRANQSLISDTLLWKKFTKKSVIRSSGVGGISPYKEQNSG